MSLKDHLPRAVADAIFEEDPTPVAQVKPSQAGYVDLQKSTLSNFIPSLGQPVPAVIPITSNPLLDDLRKRTSFEATPLGQQIQGYLEALNDTGLSEDQKIKTALKLGHITPESVVETLHGVQAVLVSDKQKFDSQMSAAQTTEVDGRQQNIASLDSHIADLESQLNAARQQKVSLTTEANEKAAKIASVRSDYSSAYDRRNTEIQQMIARYQQTSN